MAVDQVSKEPHLKYKPIEIIFDQRKWRKHDGTLLEGLILEKRYLYHNPGILKFIWLDRFFQVSDQQFHKLENRK